MVTALACAALATVAGAQGLPGGIEPPPLPAEATDALRTATEPAPYINKQTSQDVDTDYTPIAKQSKYFSLHQGAYYRDEGEGGAESEEQHQARSAASRNSAGEQVTTWDDELTDVAFMNTRNGFAAGQRKVDCGGEDRYVPVIYRYGESPTGLRWLRPTAASGGMLGDCESRPGFIGSIVWLRTTGMALAVGGDGSYPYRERGYSATDPRTGEPCNEPGIGGVTKPFGHNCDQAGLGRAWLYNHGRWQELDFDPLDFRNRPDPATDPDGADARWGNVVHGMTALDFSPLPGRDFGFAGALGQIRPFTVAVEGQNGACEAQDPNECVEFPNDGGLAVLGSGVSGRFDMDAHGEDPIPTDGETLPDTTPPHVLGPPTPGNRAQRGDTDQAFRFRFRTRQLRMAEGGYASLVGAVAVTAGCCAGGLERDLAGVAGNYPSVLLFTQQINRNLITHPVGGEGWRWQLWSGDLYGRQYERAAYYALPDAQRRALPPPPNTRQDWPDSFYAVTADYLRAENGGSRLAVIASPGGPAAEQAPERPSLVSEPLCFTQEPTAIDSPTGGYRPPVDLSQPGQLFSVLRAQLASARLVDGDGDELVAFTGPVSVGGVLLVVNSPPYAGTPANAQRFTADRTCRQGSETRNRGDQGFGGPTRDAVPDWSVGELRSTAVTGRGARGLAYSTVSRPELVPAVVNAGWTGEEERIAGNGALPPPPDPARVAATLADPVNNPPTRQEKLAAYLQSQHFFTGSYALNAIDYLDGTGSGWAVGRHGGIVQLGGESGGLAAKATVEPEPPPLGARRPSSAPERAPYEAFDAPPASPGAVPALAHRPAQRLGEHALRFAGSPNVEKDYGDRFNRLGHLVMSRDGAEGWGLDRDTEADGSRAMTVFHYRGREWSRCDPEGNGSVLAPQRACAALAPLRSHLERGALKGVAVAAAARVPYENDGDAANDDEFEVLAIGTGYPLEGEEEGAPALMRYRTGAWELDEDDGARRALSDFLPFSRGGYFGEDLTLAFAAPDDAWLIGGPRPSRAQSLVHFDGESWTACSTSLTDPAGSAAGDRAQRCDDSDNLTISAGPPPGGGQHGCSVQECDEFRGLARVGDRLYLYGFREVEGTRYPLILCKQAGSDWRSEGCGLDPGLAQRTGAGAEPGSLVGEVSALSLAIDENGARRGWAIGRFGGEAGGVTGQELAATSRPLDPATALLRLEGERWQPFADTGPIRDRGKLNSAAQVVAFDDGGGLIASQGVLLRFEHDVGGWRYLPADLRTGAGADAFHGTGAESAIAATADGEGGAWLAIGDELEADLAHYSASLPRPVFEEAPTPLPRREEWFTDLAGQLDGSLWASTSEGNLYRYARTTGWDRVPISGWRAPRAILAPAAFAVAINEAGVGIVVGAEGRIADIAGAEIRLNPAAGTLCDLARPIAEQLPCGTTRHLRAAAVAPDGAAVAGGDALSLLWRPSADGHFRAIERPEAAPSAEVTDLALPSATVAYLTTDEGQVFRGDYDGTTWSWRLEGVDGAGSLLTLDPSGAFGPAPLRAVAVDVAGHGYAAGGRGIVLERLAGSGRWRVVRSGVSARLTAVELRGEQVLIGGQSGLVLTGSGDRLAVARAANQGSGAGRTGDVVGLALAGAGSSGATEAWAVTDGPGARRSLPFNVSQLFHYASEESEPLLDPSSPRSSPLADSPAARAGEASFAAFGKLDCQRARALCPGVGAVGAEFAALSRRSAEEIAARGRQPGGPALAVFSGDLTDDGGLAASDTLDEADPPQVVADQLGPANLIGAAKLRSARTWLADPLAQSGLPFFSAVGSQDLSSSQVCHGAGNPGLNPANSCLPTQEVARPGVNDAWRRAFASEPTPWGKGGRFPSERYEVRPLSRSGAELRLPAPAVEAGDDEVEVNLLAGGARTHYAFDLIDSSTGRKAARFAFADNSLRSLQVSDPFQHPLELEANESGSGQAGWLRRVLCVKGEGSRCSRDPGQPAVVVANAPTYSNANGDPRFWAKDAALFESILLQNKATAVISGSLGWNGRYWATAPGLHEPCQGEPYRESAPQPGTSSCRGRSSSELPLGAGGIAPIANQLGTALGDAGPVVDAAQDEVNAVAGEGLLPFIVASGAGGKLSGQQAGEGFFHGYTVVRVPPDADPAGVLVEQRPLFELLSITAASHVLRPGQKMTLKGVGRGPLAYRSDGTGGRHAAFDSIDSAAVTHRYDLIEADPKKPWLAKDRYVPLDPSIATIDRESGVIEVGRGNNPRTFALGVLSVGCSGTQAGADGACDPDDPGVHVATFPLVFESRRTFKPAVVETPPLAQIRAQAQAVLPQPPNPPPPPNVQSPPLPSPPNVPVPPPVDVPSVDAPTPPIPPPPPVQQSPVPLDLSASAPSVTIAPQTTVIPPPAPPIQPAPPGGARREARQRQSATQSSGSGSGQGEGVSEIREGGGDLAQGGDMPGGSSAFTRYDRTRADGGSVTLLYGGGITLLALVAALGFSHNRPGPRRRAQIEPSPAWARINRRWP